MNAAQNTNPWLIGREPSLAQILDAREERWHSLLKAQAAHPKTLLSLTLNIPGPIKQFPLAENTFDEGMASIQEILRLHQCEPLLVKSFPEETGSWGYILTDADPVDCKRWTTKLEETHPLGRIWDIDVLRANGEKISRQAIGYPARACLLCGRPAFLCGRSRAHNPEELLDREIAWMQDFFTERLSRRIAGLFTKAMTYEVTTTPKPGLVDSCHNGSHRDMDIGLFMDSIAALFPYFQKCGAFGARWPAKDEPGLFAALRPLGIEAENTMYQATNHVNTHKGLIFSGGILCAAAAHTIVQKKSCSPADLSALCVKMLSALEADFENGASTHGMQLYKRYGFKGIRGEAAAGFPTLFGVGLPVFLRCRSLGFFPFKSGRIALLHLIACCEDTNFITRAGFSSWKTVTQRLNSFLKSTPLDQLPEKEILQEMDVYFIRKNISPGGSADLLALVYFLYFLTNTEFWNHSKDF